jgi:surfeit locus 1 family protein
VIFRLGSSRYRYQFHSGFFSLCALFTVLCCLLSLWQYHRYTLKLNLQNAYQQNSHATPSPFLTAAKTKNPSFKKVIVTGQLDDTQVFFLQNQVLADRIGLHVIVPLHIAGSTHCLLVDLGWVGPYAHPEKNLPAVSMAKGSVELTGTLKKVNEYQFILGKNVTQLDKGPLVLQKIDTADITAVTHQSYFPFVLMLDPTSRYGFEKTPYAPQFTPERHAMYTIQWLLFGLILIISYLASAFKKIPD